MKPIMRVDFLRDEIGFVTTDRRRGKLPKLVSRQHTVYPVVYVIISRSLREQSSPVATAIAVAMAAVPGPTTLHIRTITDSPKPHIGH
jgi:hypothetical protein